MWSEASFHDVVAVLMGAQRIVLERLDPDEPLSGANPLVPKIKEDRRLRDLAKLLLARDTQAAVEALIPWDLTPETQGGRIGFGWAHWCYAETRTNEAYDIAGALDVPGGNSPNGGGAAHEYFYMYELSLQGGSYGGGGLPGLRHTCGATVPRLVSGSYQTPSGTKALAARIYAASLEQTASDVGIDAGLAATITANLAATRASYLARSQAMYPERGYT